MQLTEWQRIPAQLIGSPTMVRLIAYLSLSGLILSQGCGDQRPMDVHFDLTGELTPTAIHWRETKAGGAASDDWEVPVDGGVFTVDLSGGSDLKCSPERVFVNRADGEVRMIWIVFPIGSARDAASQADTILGSVGVPTEAITHGIRKMNLLPGSMQTFYEKHLRPADLSEKCKSARIRSISLEAHGSGFKNKPVTLHAMLFFETKAEKDKGETSK